MAQNDPAHESNGPHGDDAPVGDYDPGPQRATLREEPGRHPLVPDEDEEEGPSAPPAVPDGGGDEVDVVPPITAAARDQSAMDRLMEESGITVVDEVDALEWEMIREGKVLTLRELRHKLETVGADVDPKDLAAIGQKLGQMEKDKMAVIQLKIGKPSDRVKPGTKFKARIGIAARKSTAEGGGDAPTIVGVELEATE